MEYIINVPKKYNSCKWNGMKVNIISEEDQYAIVVNRKGKKIRINKKWLITIKK